MGVMGALLVRAPDAGSIPEPGNSTGMATLLNVEAKLGVR